MPNSYKDIDLAKKEAIDYLKQQVGKMNKAAYDVLMRTIENTFDISAGNIQAGAGFVNQLNKLTAKVIDLLQTNPSFSGNVGRFVKRLNPVSEAITDYQKTANGISVPDMITTKKIITDEIIDKMLNNGLNQSFVQPMRDLIYRNVTGGLSLADARIQIKNFIGTDTTSKLGSYLEQTAIQATDAYSGAINTKLLETFSYDGLLITGSLIDNSSPQCRFAIEDLGGKITRENWPKVEEIGKKQSGWIKNTTFDNLPTNRLHWGCRHSFYPIKLKKQAA